VPTYQYRCTDCGEPLEVVQSFTDPALTECPSCDGTLRKVFSSVGVVFKGSGFYRTDSRADAKNGSKSETTTDTKVAANSDSKSEAKAETKSSDTGSGTKSDKPAASGGKSGSSTSTSSAA
jgi:putative FmdB family regulatory protein